MLILIAAMTRQRLIGSGGGLPWDIPEEYRQFLSLVSGKTVLMGRRAFEIFGPDLDDSHNLVLSRSLSEPGSGPEPGTAEVFDTLEAALGRAFALGRPIFCAGGASLYEQTLPLADKLYVSYVEGDYSGEIYFPAFDETEWDVERRREHRRFDFVVYRRRPS